MARLGEDLTLGQLRTFVCVARAGSFVRAADVLGISQPAVSEQITSLEERLGYALFRRRRGTTPLLTADGAEVLRKAHDIIEAADGLIRHTDQPTHRTVVLNMSIGPRLCDGYLKPLLPRIYREHPEIRIDTQPLIPFSEVGRALSRGRIDLAVYTVSAHGEGWTSQSRSVCEVPSVLVAPVGTTRDIASGRITLEDCQFLIPGDREVVGAWVASLFAELGINPRRDPVYFQLGDVIEQLVIDGEGVSVLMYETVKDSIREGRLEVLDCKLPRLHRVIGRSPHAPREARIVEDYLCEALLGAREVPLYAAPAG